MQRTPPTHISHTHPSHPAHPQALSYAVAGNARNAAALVSAGGLKAVFPSFMGAGAAHTRRHHGDDGVAEEEEQTVALVASLVALLPPTGSGAGAAPAAGEAWLRLLAKFREDGGAKLHRLVDLYVSAADRVAAAEADADAEGGDDNEDEEGGEGADEDDIETDAAAEAKVRKEEGAGVRVCAWCASVCCNVLCS